jgi:hypothetical protein
VILGEPAALGVYLGLGVGSVGQPGEAFSEPPKCLRVPQIHQTQPSPLLHVRDLLLKVYENWIFLSKGVQKS